MKPKRLKSTKKTLKALEKQMKFRKPYQVILEESFIKDFDKHKLNIRLFDSVLLAEVKYMVTDCSYKILKQVNSKEEDAKQSILKHCEIRRCKHEDGTKTNECIKDLIKKNNKNHYFVACNDIKLRKELRKYSVPLLYLKKSVLILEPFKLNTIKSEHEEENLDKLKSMFPEV